MTSSTADMESLSPAATNDLATLVQNLPQELFDKIFELVIQVESKEVVTITKNYRQPVALHISSAIRRDKAQIYYNTNKFTTCNDAEKHMREWLQSLPKGHRNAIDEIRIARWDVTISKLTSHGLIFEGYGSPLRSTQLLAIPHMKLALTSNRTVYDWALEGFLGHLRLKVDFKIGDGQMAWMNWKELEAMYYQLSTQ